jgi:predicted small secreted protein
MVPLSCRAGNERATATTCFPPAMAYDPPVQRHWERTMRLVITLLVGMLALSACNTFEGFGRDMQDAGEAIEEEAEE